MSERHPTTSASFPTGETPALRGLADHLTAVADPDGLSHLILHDRGTARIAVSTDPPDAAGGPAPGTGTDHARNGRQLYLTLQDLAPELAQLRSGVLMRTVIEVPTGAIFFYLVGGDVHLYGATRRADRADELDRRMAEVANAIRRDWRYHELDFGSFLSGARRDDGDPAAGPTAADAAGATAADVDTTPADTAPADTAPADDADADVGDVPDLLRGALSRAGLHYVAYRGAGGAEAVAVDVFDDPALEGFFAFLTRDERRARYRRLGEQLPGLANWLNTALWAVTGGEAVRLVLDVELGALYLLALPDDRWLVGVTLDQSRVAAADRAMHRLAALLRRRIGAAES